MIQANQVEVPIDYSRIRNNHLCPECGSLMTEADRVNENGFYWMWFMCSQEDCDGQWLTKKRADLI
jgi:hypothetical protein